MFLNRRLTFDLETTMSQAFITPGMTTERSGWSKFWEAAVAFIGLANIIILVVVFLFYREKIDEANKSITQARDDALKVQGAVEGQKKMLDEQIKQMQAESDRMKSNLESTKNNLNDSLGKVKEQDEQIKSLLQLTPSGLKRLAAVFKENDQAIKLLIEANLTQPRILDHGTIKVKMSHINESFFVTPSFDYNQEDMTVVLTTEYNFNPGFFYVASLVTGDQATKGRIRIHVHELTSKISNPASEFRVHWAIIAKSK